MKTHFDPYLTDIPCDSDTAICGTRLGEEMDSSNNWKNVDCKRCLKQREKIDAGVAADEAEINRQYGQMADFMSAQAQEGGN